MTRVAARATRFAERPVAVFGNLLPFEVLDVLVVFLTDVLDQLAPQQAGVSGERPRLRESLGIVDGVHDLQVAIVGAGDALGNLHV